METTNKSQKRKKSVAENNTEDEVKVVHDPVSLPEFDRGCEVRESLGQQDGRARICSIWCTNCI
jgi:hypothetical protein